MSLLMLQLTLILKHTNHYLDEITCIQDHHSVILAKLTNTIKVIKLMLNSVENGNIQTQHTYTGEPHGPIWQLTAANTGMPQHVHSFHPTVYLSLPSLILVDI